MLTQAISLLTAVIVMQGAAETPKADSVKLQRVYKSGDADTYALTATLSEGGADMSITAQVLLKVLSEEKEGAAQVELSAPKLAMVAGGVDTGEPAPEAIKTKFNRNGMPAQLEVKDAKWVYVLLCVSSYVPAADTESGKEFTINWAADGSTINGKGKVVEIVMEEGKKVAVVKSKVSVTPQNDEPGDVEVTSRIDVETGKLIKCEGKVLVGGHASATFAIKRVIAKG